MSVLLKTGQVELVHQSQSVRATEVLKQATNRTTLFTDAGSPYCTELGNQKRTEFVYFAPNKADWRIECKSRQTIGLLGEISHELNYVAEIPEELYCLVLTENLLTPYFLKELTQIITEKNLEEKVWIGSKKQFKKMLEKCI
jgi:hypothetical protein